VSWFPHCSIQQYTFIALVGATLIGFLFLFVDEKQRPWEGCRAASKTEYESAKSDFLLQTSFGAYATTGHWWRPHYWFCHL
jgi:hypothetical protein